MTTVYGDMLNEEITRRARANNFMLPFIAHKATVCKRPLNHCLMSATGSSSQYTDRCRCCFLFAVIKQI